LPSGSPSPRPRLDPGHHDHTSSDGRPCRSAASSGLPYNARRFAYQPGKEDPLIVILVAIAVCLLLLGIWSARRPLDALILLLALMVFHSGLSRVLENVFVLDNSLVLLLSAWKEAVIAGLAVAAFVRLRRGSVHARLSPAYWRPSSSPSQ